jgi:hypothetical protein
VLSTFAHEMQRHRPMSNPLFLTSESMPIEGKVRNIVMGEWVFEVIGGGQAYAATRTPKKLMTNAGDWTGDFKKGMSE